MFDLSLQNPLFSAYAIAASLMILKAVAMSWLTVVRMMQRAASARRRTCARPRSIPRPTLSSSNPTNASNASGAST